MAGVAWGAPVEFKALRPNADRAGIAGLVCPNRSTKVLLRRSFMSEIPFMLTMKEKGVYCDIVELGEDLEKHGFSPLARQLLCPEESR